jgi:prepilin-type N-terminal cleavage/methylation domain-containing protein
MKSYQPASCQLPVASCQLRAARRLPHRFSGGGANGGSCQLSAISFQPEGRLARRLRCAGRPAGFTLLELTIVVGILALLFAIAVPAGTAVLNSTRHKSTLKTMEVLRQAIEEYGRSPAPGAFGPAAPVPFPPDDYSLGLTDSAGQTECEDFIDSLPFDHVWQPGETVEDDNKFPIGNLNKRYTPGCLARDIPNVYGAASGEEFVRASAGLVPQPDPQPLANNPFPAAADNVNNYDGDNRSIEALVLYCRMLSRNGEAIFTSLGNNVVKNADRCTGGVACPDVLIVGRRRVGNAADFVLDTGPTARRVDLMEVYDSWNRPLRYGVHQISTSNGEPVWGWELRSAGPDGKFEEMFDKNKDGDGDDVVMSGK